jgi:hypothetical protein
VVENLIKSNLKITKETLACSWKLELRKLLMMRVAWR